MKRRWLAIGSLVAVGLVASERLRADGNPAAEAQALIAGLDYEKARALLAEADAEAPAVAIERARLAIYELDCDGAVAVLGRPELQKSGDGAELAEIARGCQRVTAALVTDVDPERSIEVRWQDEHDRALAPLLYETVARAREALTRDLGVDWPLPTRVVVVRDLLSLSAMTGLPYKSAQTTGTVAVAKWGRVTLLSPRATLHGYPWRDTVAHELTHLAVTRASGDRAPLWLQEGIAKREEVRWREPGPFDDRPPAEAIVQHGIERGLAVPLDKLGPSIAMLPSADAATVAFAEVTSFVQYYVDNGGDGALRQLLAQLRLGRSPDEALVAASGADRKSWDARWRAAVASRPHEPLPALFGLGSAPARPGSIEESRGEDARLRELRDRTRLAELLLARRSSNAPLALGELDRIAATSGLPAAGERGVASGDPSIRWLRARALEEAGRRAEGEPLVADPKQVLASYGSWWALRGRWARLRGGPGDEALAGSSFFEAIAADPLNPEAACETIDPTAPARDPANQSLCDAARARAEPPFGGD